MARADQLSPFPRPSRLAFLAGAFAGAFLASGCSSKNPDSLIGMNVDENLAVMDANEVSSAHSAAEANAASNARLADDSANRADLSTRTARASMNSQVNSESQILPSDTGARAQTTTEANEGDAAQTDENQSEPPH